MHFKHPHVWDHHDADREVGKTGDRGSCFNRLYTGPTVTNPADTSTINSAGSVLVLLPQLILKNKRKKQLIAVFCKIIVFVIAPKLSLKASKLPVTSI